MNPVTKLPAPIALAAIAVVTIGCGGEVAEDKPTYADLVVIYNAELEALDRLEKQKQDLIAKSAAELRPSPEDAVQALGDALTAASELTRDVDSDTALDPQAALDRAVENAQSAQDAVSQLLDSVNQPSSAESEEEAARRTKITAELNQQLAALDEEIAKQKQRVERARQARDAAEANY